MGTRSNIIVQSADGTRYRRIYVHWDGYIEGVGRTLFDHYNSQDRADSLVALGDISSLDERNDGAPGHDFESRVEGQTVYYGRDRGEDGVEPQDFAKLGGTADDEEAAFPRGIMDGAEFIYFYGTAPGGPNEPQWWVADPDLGVESFVPLAKVFSGEIEGPTPDIKAFGGNFVIGHRDPARA